MGEMTALRFCPVCQISAPHAPTQGGWCCGFCGSFQNQKDKSKDLHFILTAKYYDEIARGEKVEEYRECEQWRKRIEGREYRNIVFHRGYTLTTQAFPYRGYEVRTITHPHFGLEPVTVYVLPLSTAPSKGEAGEPTETKWQTE